MSTGECAFCGADETFFVGVAYPGYVGDGEPPTDAVEVAWLVGDGPLGGVGLSCFGCSREMHEYGESLARFRDKLGVSRRALAARLGVSKATVERWELGWQEIAHPGILIPAMGSIVLAVAEIGARCNPTHSPN